MKLRTLKEAKLSTGSRALVRADFDVALKNGKIVEDFRIKAVVPTLKFLLSRGVKIRILSHLGRPKGKKVSDLSMQKIAVYLSWALKMKIIFVKNPFSPAVFKKLNDSQDILFFENLRFWPGEEKNDQKFAKSLAHWGDFYVNEAFANCHRNHASMMALPKILPAFAGLNLEKEIFYLDKIFKNPRKPVALLLGGAKLETKLPLIFKFLNSGNEVLVGGALAATFFLSQGQEVGKSLAEADFVSALKRLRECPKNLYLPSDVRLGTSAMRGKVRVAAPGEIKKNEAIFDIGPKTEELFGARLLCAKTIFWNGPLGLAEIPRFAQGTVGVARRLKKAKGLRILGGGDVIAILRKHRLLAVFDHISTGGGAMLEYLAGEKLPALEILKK